MSRQARGTGSVYLRGRVWWIQYCHRGDVHKESSGSTARGDANRMLRKRLGEMGLGTFAGPDPEKVTLRDLRTMLLDDYALKGNKTSKRAEQSFEHVLGFFMDAKALDVTSDALVSYAKYRQEEGAKPATAKNELAALKRSYNLAVRAGRLHRKPAFPTISTENRRQGFFEESEFRAVAAKLPGDVADVAEFLYWTGWRKGEALSLEWRHVDLKAQVVRIETSKNREPRTLPYGALPALVDLFNRRRELTTVAEQAQGIIVPAVFHRDGAPIKTFRRSWLTACREAGVPQRITHDFRRTAARNLSRAGVPERVIMAVCGWRTRSVFDRYRIVNEQDLSDGLGKLASAKPAERTGSEVVQFRTR